IFKVKEVQAQTYLNQLREFANKYYKKSDIYRDFPTIAIDMQHMKFELVPAYLDSDWRKIPAPREKAFKWITTNPEAFKRKLQERSIKTKGVTAQAIKIIKYLNYLNAKPFDSYEIEQFVLAREFTGSDIRAYYFDLMSGLLARANTEPQKEFSKKII